MYSQIMLKLQDLPNSVFADKVDSKSETLATHGLLEVILRRIAVNKGGRFLILSTDAFAGLPVLIQYVVHISTRSHLQPFGIHFIVSTASCRNHAATPLCLGYFTSQLARHGPTLSFGPVVRQY
jgi:hypothetical protein